MSAPGSWLQAIAARCCRTSTVERLVDPIVADLQTELASLGNRSGWRRHRLLWATYAGFWTALGLHFALSVLRPPSGEDRRLSRAIGVSILMLALFTTILIGIPLVDGMFPNDRWAFRAILVLLLIPQALPVSIPPAMSIGILYAMRGHAANRRDLYGVLAVAIVASVLVAGVMEWGIPRANQAFRELVYAQLTGRSVHLEPGLNELGFSGLRQRTDPQAIRVYHLFLALSFASIPLALLALAMAQRVRGVVAALSFALVSLAGYYAGLWVTDGYLRAGVPLPVLTAWAPNALCLLTAFTLGLRRHVRA